MVLDFVLFVFVVLYDCLVIYVLIMLVSTVGSKSNLCDHNERYSKAYCDCWNKRTPMSWKQMSYCSCGEDNDVGEWKWERPNNAAPSWVVVSEDRRRVTFHPYYSSGTAAVRGDTPLQLNHHYYWEVKMLTETYGTDIMIGVGTSKVDISESQFQFTSLLGQDGESYGLSYTGALRHGALRARAASGFCRGSIVGVRVDMWRGTLQFYLNRQPQGISFYNLRRHKLLFPMLSSTAAQSSMKLIYAASWRASLLVDAAKTLAAAAAGGDTGPRLPPGLWHAMRKQFWLTLPTEECNLVGDLSSDSSSESDDAMDDASIPSSPVSVASAASVAIATSAASVGLDISDVESITDVEDIYDGC